jgi:hypothetical protein
MPNPFGPLYSIDFVVLVVCAIFWFKAAELEKVPPWIWTGLSIFTYAYFWLERGWGILGCLFAQVVLALAIGIFRVWWESRGK